MSENFIFKPKTESVQPEDIVALETPEEYLKVLFWSFLLSQGDGGAQGQVLRFCHQMTGPVPNDVFQGAANMFIDKYMVQGDFADNLKRIHGHYGFPNVTPEYYDAHAPRHTTDTPRKSLQYTLRLMNFNPTREGVSGYIPGLFAGKTWNTDYKYLCSKNSQFGDGRPEAILPANGKDLWESFGVRFFIKQEAMPPIPVLKLFLQNEMQRMPCIEKKYDQGEELYAKEKVAAVMDVYDAKHPEQTLTKQERDAYLGVYN